MQDLIERLKTDLNDPAKRYGAVHLELDGSGNSAIVGESANW